VCVCMCVVCVQACWWVDAGVLTARGGKHSWLQACWGLLMRLMSQADERALTRHTGTDAAGLQHCDQKAVSCRDAVCSPPPLLPLTQHAPAGVCGSNEGLGHTCCTSNE